MKVTDICRDQGITTVVVEGVTSVISILEIKPLPLSVIYKSLLLSKIEFGLSSPVITSIVCELS